mgnify:CR=1 FL=1
MTVGAFDRFYAAWLSLMLMSLTVSFLVIEGLAMRNRRFARVGTGVQRRATPVPLGRMRPFAKLFLALVYGASLGLPLLVIYAIPVGMLGGGVPFVAVGVVLLGELAVGLLDRRLVGVLGDTEEGVEVLVQPVLTGHVSSSRSSRYCGSATATRAARRTRSPAR